MTPIACRLPRVLVPLLLGTVVLSAAAKGDIGYDIPQTTMPFSFKSRKYGGTKRVAYSMPDPCMSFIRLQGGEGRRPLYVTGRGRYGHLLLTLGCEPMAEFFDYELEAAVDGVIVYDDYGASGIGDPERYSGGGLLDERPSLRLHVTGFEELDERGEKLRRFLRYRRPPVEDEPWPGHPRLVGRLRGVLSCGEHRIELEDLPMTIDLHFRLHPIPYRPPCPYWQLIFRCEETTVDGADLGLDGAGRLALTIAGGVLAPIADPATVKGEALEDTTKAIDRIRDRLRGGGGGNDPWEDLE